MVEGDNYSYPARKAAGNCTSMALRVRLSCISLFAPCWLIYSVDPRIRQVINHAFSFPLSSDDLELVDEEINPSGPRVQASRRLSWWPNIDIKSHRVLWLVDTQEQPAPSRKEAPETASIMTIEEFEKHWLRGKVEGSLNSRREDILRYWNGLNSMINPWSYSVVALSVGVLILLPQVVG